MAAQIIGVIKEDSDIVKVVVVFNNKGKRYKYTSASCTQSELQNMIRIQERGLGGLTRYMQAKGIIKRNA